MLYTVWKPLIVRPLNPVVQITSAGKDVTYVRTTTNVDRTSIAVKANASVVCLLVLVRTTTNVTLERNVVREYVRHTVVGAAELLQALPLEVLSSSPSSFPLYPASAVLLARTTVIVYPVL